MKSIKVPYINGLEKMDFENFRQSMEKDGSHDVIASVNWPDEFPYRPDCEFYVARSQECIAVLYHVKGQDLRAAAMQDNGPVWEDSCCEFFVQDPSDGTYYNFELNCVGTLLNAKGSGREKRVYRSEKELNRVRRFHSLDRKEYSENNAEFSWTVGMVIPFDLMGINPSDLPSVLKANFYKCADKTAHVHFLSWNPVGCPSPDFHRPDYFGELYL